MSEIATVERQHNGVLISLRTTDQYIDATAMCQAHGKLWADYWRLKGTQEFAKAFSETMGIPIESLVESTTGRHGGTYIHPDLAVQLAQWCNPMFAVQVSRWIRELMATGRVELAPAPVRRPWFERLDVSLLDFRARIISECPRGSWAVLTATVVEVLLIEDEFLRHCLPANIRDLPDGSVGQRWRTYRKDQPWAGEVSNGISLLLPSHGRDGSDFFARPCIYRPEELLHFQEWLYDTYFPEHLPQYLINKFARQGFGLAPASAADAACQKIVHRPAVLPARTRRQLEAAGGFAAVGYEPPREIQQGGLFD